MIVRMSSTVNRKSMAAGTIRGEDGRPTWLCRKIHGILLDISGVLYNSGVDGGSAIPGSVEAVEK